MAQQFTCTGRHNSTKVAASLIVHLGIYHAQAMSANLGYKLLSDVNTSA